MLLFAKARPSQARGIAKVLEEFWVMLVLKVSVVKSKTFVSRIVTFCLRSELDGLPRLS